MNRLMIFAAIAVLSVPACTQPGLSPPSSIADRTTADEYAAIGFDTAVEVVADLAAEAVKDGTIRGDQLPKLREMSRKAREAVKAVGAAYRSGNGDNVVVAVAQAQAAIAAIRALSKGQAPQ